MTNRNTQPKRILSIAFNMRGFGFAVLDGESVLIDWGIKATWSDNAGALRKISELIRLYAPDVIVAEDFKLSPFHHSARIHRLSAALAKLAEKFGILVKQLSLLSVRENVFDDQRATKYD